MKQTRSFLESQITKQRFKPCLPQNDSGSPKTKQNAKRNRFHWKECFLLRGKAFSKMIAWTGFLFISLLFPLNWVWKSKVMNLFFAMQNSFLKKSLS